MTLTQPRVAVVSSGQTALSARHDRFQHVDLIGAAVTRALKGTGITTRDIDFVIDSGSDVLDGRSISNCGFLGAMGAHHKEESRVEEDGLWAALYAVTKLRAGPGTVGLVVAYSKPSESDIDAFYSTLCDPFYQRPVGLNQRVASGLAAREYILNTDATEESFVLPAESDWANALRNPNVDLTEVPDAASIAAGRVVASPLREHQLSRNVDGAVAVVLAIEDVAARITSTPVWITGMGAAMDSQQLSEREPGRFEACDAAATQAYRAAGLGESPTFDVAEVSALSIAEELMVLEGLRLAERGHAADVYDDSILAVNPSGGAIPADAVMATGLLRLKEAAAALVRSRTGGRAVVHASGGIGMQNHCVFTLEV